MNTYVKYAPNVFVARCSERHEKGEIITLETKHGKQHECIVFNLVAEMNCFFYYSIVRADGFNVQEWAKRRAERHESAAIAADEKSEQYWKKSNKDADFLSLGEPIKVGHPIS